MNRRIFFMLVFIGIAIIAMLVAIIHFTNQSKAIKIAQEYLSQKYNQEMQYSRIRFSWIDPALYHVYFSTVENPDVVIEVEVQTEFTINEPKITDKYDYMPDYFYAAHFEFELRNLFINDVDKIWGVNADIGVLVLNPFAVPHGYNSKAALEYRAALFDEYLLVINTSQNLTDESKLDEAQKMFGLIKIVQESAYKPKYINFWYNVPKTAKKSEEVNVFFDSWMNIDSVEQVLEQIKHTIGGNQ
jgi:hypothetical protein